MDGVGRPIYLARHGATRANERGVRIGRSPEALSVRGIAQAEALARAVQRTEVRVIWASPLVRARQTAEIVGRACGLAVHTSDDLCEMDYGPLEGLTEPEIALRHPEEERAWSGELHVAPRGAEPLASVAERVVRAIERIRADGVALIVTHLTPLRLAFAHYGRVPIPHAPRFFPENGALYRLSARGLELVDECRAE
ncbi:MAG TPA: histidine phosphatase family protein [Sandaracinaceae bacterium]